jgi:hypothetical protein
MSNVTFVGSEQVAEENFAMVFRTGASPTLANIAATGFSAGCLALRDQATLDHFAASEASIGHTVLACGAPFEDGAEEQGVFDAGSGNAVVADLMLTSVSLASPDWRPQAQSPLLGGGQAPSDPWFEAASFVGAFDASDDWTEGWISTPQN